MSSAKKIKFPAEKYYLPMKEGEEAHWEVYNYTGLGVCCVQLVVCSFLRLWRGYCLCMLSVTKALAMYRYIQMSLLFITTNSVRKSVIAGDE